MPWENRNGRGRYYTRSRRVNGKIIREYLGAGPKAEEAARADTAARAERVAQRAAQNSELALARDLECQLDALCRSTDELIGVELRAAGYHQHARGAWRKIRVKSNQTSQTSQISQTEDSNGAAAATTSAGGGTSAPQNRLDGRGAG